MLTSKLRPKTNALAHKGHLHVAIVGTKQNLRRKVWWPNVWIRQQRKSANLVMNVNWLHIHISLSR